MTRWLAVLVLAVWAIPLSAQVVRVSSGDHADFTRLVLEFPAAVDWQVGRTADGYELRLQDGKIPTYDLAAVFDLIGRSRLAAIWAEPDSGALKMSVACACHAIPFEFRPGTIVIDLRDGPPPNGSSFEMPLTGANKLVALSNPPVPRPQARPEAAEPALPKPEAVDAEAKPERPKGPSYRWSDLRVTPSPAEPEGRPDLALLDRSLARPQGDVAGLEPLRQSLIEELGHGATQGIVEMALPSSVSDSGHGEGQRGGTEGADQDQVAISLGGAANLEVRQKGEAAGAMTGQGRVCIADERLAIADWAEEIPISQQMGPALSGLVGEFDQPEPNAVARAVKFYLSVGFGAEARAILRSFPGDQEDRAIWLSMAGIIDAMPVAENAFAGMSACSTSAALWALLAEPEALALGQVEKAAVLRGFSALPRQLRQDFGPRLATRFLQMKDLTTASALRDAIMRGIDTPTPEAERIQAALEAAGGSPAASAARLEGLAENQGNSDSGVLAELVIQRAELGQSVTYEQLLALQAFASELGEGEDRDQIELAVTLAHGASGDFDAAFDRLSETPDAAPVIWDLLARSGRDSPLLERAVLPADEAMPKAARPVATLIAQRLVTLGLADQAARWLAMEGSPPPILAAKVALGQGDAERALLLLGEDPSKLADDVRLSALGRLGDDAAIARLYAERGLSEDAYRAVSRMQNWQRLASEGPDVWKEAAQHLLGPPATGETGGSAPELAATPLGPLERGRRLVADSEATRAALSVLLGSMDAPLPATQ